MKLKEIVFLIFMIIIGSILSFLTIKGWNSLTPERCYIDFEKQNGGGYFFQLYDRQCKTLVERCELIGGNLDTLGGDDRCIIPHPNQTEIKYEGGGGIPI